jgi:hypothetical protein
MFSVLGLLLAGYGLLGDPRVYAVSLGVNVNLWSGLGMLVFGALMLAGAGRGKKAEDRRQKTEDRRQNEP